MADVQRPEGQFPRLNHALLQAGNFSNQIASFVGKAVNFDGQATLTFECADGGKVTMQVSPEFAFEPGKPVEVMGSVNEDKTVQYFISRDLGDDFDFANYNGLITKVMTNPKYADLFAIMS